MIDPTDINRISKILVAARKERRKRSVFWKEYRNELVGGHWREGSGRTTVSNNVYSYNTTMMALLADRRPHADVRSKRGIVAQFLADAFEQGLNDAVEAQKLLTVIRAAIFNSFYSIGIVKTGVRLEDAGAGDTGEDGTNTGRFVGLVPFAVSISPFNFLWDDSAKSMVASQFYAHEFTRDLQRFMEDPRYDTSKIDVSTLMTTTTGTGVSRQGYESDDTRGLLQEEMLKNMPDSVKLVEMYLRDSKLYVTLIEVSQDRWEIVRIAQHTGRDSGPYHFLSYMELGETAMPVSPGHGWWEQKAALDIQEEEMMHQIRNEKTIVVFGKAGKSAADITKEAKDHGIVTGINDNELGRQVTYGGVTDQKLTAVVDARIRFESASGLSDHRRGVQSRTGETATATTERSQAGAFQISSMSGRIEEFTTEILEDWKDYMWNDPSVIVPITLQESPDADPIDLVMRGGGETNGIRASDIFISIRKGSMVRPDNALDRMQAVEETSLLLNPMVIQLAMAQGLMPDILGILRSLGERIGREDFEQYFIPMTPQALQLMLLSQSKVPNAEQTGSVTNIQGVPNRPPRTDVGILNQNVLGGSETATDAGNVAAPLSAAQR